MLLIARHIYIYTIVPLGLKSFGEMFADVTFYYKKRMN